MSHPMRKWWSLGCGCVSYPSEAWEAGNGETWCPEPQIFQCIPSLRKVFWRFQVWVIGVLFGCFGRKKQRAIPGLPGLIIHQGYPSISRRTPMVRVQVLIFTRMVFASLPTAPPPPPPQTCQGCLELVATKRNMASLNFRGAPQTEAQDGHVCFCSPPPFRRKKKGRGQETAKDSLV